MVNSGSFSSTILSSRSFKRSSMNCRSITFPVYISKYKFWSSSYKMPSASNSSRSGTDCFSSTSSSSCYSFSDLSLAALTPLISLMMSAVLTVGMEEASPAFWLLSLWFCYLLSFNFWTDLTRDFAWLWLRESPIFLFISYELVLDNACFDN